MSGPSESHLPTARRTLRLRSRADVQAVGTEYSGQPAHVLKDPVTMAFFHLTPEEYLLFERLRGATSLGELREAFLERFAPRTITVEAIQEGVDRLFRQGLLVSDNPDQGEQLLRRASQERWKQRAAACGRLICMKAASWGCGGFIDGLYKLVRPVFSLLGLALAALLVLTAANLALGHGREMAARLPSFAELTRPAMLPVWLVTIAAVKCIHELAHALACKHFGARCHEMGLLLLGFIPTLYCDASDAWRLPSKWARIGVSSAGMIAELLLASAALVAWWNLEPGLLQTAMLSVVVTCTVGTLVVNANPLLRYDGYYILSDLVGVPNLASRSREFIVSRFSGCLTAQPVPEDPSVPRSKRPWLVLYAVGSTAYLTLVLLGIYALLLHAAKPFRLENIVHTLAVVSVAGFLGPVGWRALKAVRTPHFAHRLRKGRAAVAGALLVGAVAAVLLLPIPRRVRAEATIVPADSRPVYAAAAGVLETSLGHAAVVAQGDVIATLRNPDADLRLEHQRGECAVLRERRDQLLAQRAIEPSVAKELPVAEEELAAAEEELARLEELAADLVVAAPRDGVLFAPPERVGEDRPGRLPKWAGRPLEERNRGCWIEPRTVLAVVGTADHSEVLLSIDQGDAPLVEPGQPVEVLLDDLDSCRLRGEVVEVARRGVSADPIIAKENPQRTNRHVVKVRLEDPNAPIPTGARGRAKIDTGSTTLYELAAGRLKRMLRFSW